MFGDMGHSQNFGIQLRNKQSLEVAWILLCIVGEKNQSPICTFPDLDRIVLWDSSSTDMGLEMALPPSTLS